MPRHVGPNVQAVGFDPAVLSLRVLTPDKQPAPKRSARPPVSGEQADYALEDKGDQGVFHINPKAKAARSPAG